MRTEDSLLECGGEQKRQIRSDVTIRIAQGFARVLSLEQIPARF